MQTSKQGRDLEVTSDQLRELLNELILERNTFTRENEELVRANEKRLKKLYQLNEKFSGNSSGWLGKKKGGNELGAEKRFGTPLKSEFLIVEYGL